MKLIWLARAMTAALMAAAAANGAGRSFPPSRSGLSFGPSQSGARRPLMQQGRDVNSNLAFLGFVMALLDTVINIISIINENNNNNNNINNSNNNNLSNLGTNSMGMNDNMAMGKSGGWSWLDALLSRPLDGLWNWAQALARYHPTCITRLVCETHRMSEHHSGVTYLITTFLSSASSFLLAEAFQQQVGLSELTEAARVGRQHHNCYPLRCSLF